VIENKTEKYREFDYEGISMSHFQTEESDLLQHWKRSLRIWKYIL